MSITRRDEIVDRDARGETLEEIAAAVDVSVDFVREVLAKAEQAEEARYLPEEDVNLGEA